MFTAQLLVLSVIELMTRFVGAGRVVSVLPSFSSDESSPHPVTAHAITNAAKIAASLESFFINPPRFSFFCFLRKPGQSQISAKSKKNLSIPYTKKKQSARSLRMKKGKRHATAHPRTGTRLLKPKPNLERKKIRARLPPARKVRPRASAPACSNQSRTENGNNERNCPLGKEGAPPRTGARLLQPKPNLERKKIRARLPPGKEGAPPHTGARLLQPKPNLERKKIRARLSPARKVRPAHRRTLAPTKAELRTEKDTRPPSPRQGRCAPRTGARLLQPKPNLERKKIRKRLDPLGERRYFFPTHRKTMGKMRNPPFFGALLSGGEITVMR